jgi:hypothetical protein
MSERIIDLYDSSGDFDDLLSRAEDEATTNWEMGFTSDLRDRFDEYGDEMYLTERQREILERIAHGD